MNDLTIQELADGICEESDTFGTAVVALDGRWLKVNQYLCDMLGYSESELLELTFQELTYPEDLLSEQPYLERLRSGNIDHYQFRKRYLRKDGTIVWGVLDRSIERDEKRAPRVFISHIWDITAQKLEEQRRIPLLRRFGTAMANRCRKLFARR